MKNAWTLVATCVALAALSTAAPRQDADHDAIVAAVGAYVDAFYQQKPELFDRGVSDELVKYGYSRGEDGAYAGGAMSLDTLRAIASRFHDYVELGPEPPREITVLDRLDKTATAKLSAVWGVDYLHLAKTDDGWRIFQVLWQEPPLSVASEEGEADQAAIRRAVLDYVESAYDVKPELVDRSVSRDLAKIGFTQRDGDSEWRRHDMNFDQLRALVASWNADGHMPSEPRKDVAVLDRLDKIASAKVTAEWGVDYFQLEQSDDGAWHIRHVLWQSHPRKADEAERDAAGR